jgi:hypothetical protein
LLAELGPWTWCWSKDSSNSKAGGVSKYFVARMRPRAPGFRYRRRGGAGVFALEDYRGTRLPLDDAEAVLDFILSG